MHMSSTNTRDEARAYAQTLLATSFVVACRKGHKDPEARRARLWFKEGSGALAYHEAAEMLTAAFNEAHPVDFMETCRAAGLDPAEVRATALPLFRLAAWGRRGLGSGDAVHSALDGYFEDKRRELALDRQIEHLRRLAA